MLECPMAETPHRAGFVVILGRPSVGKSTLMNAFLKFKLSITSPRPQTTRHRILGILDGEGYQVCFLDTPGLLPDPRDPLQTALRQTAKAAAHDETDVMILLVEPNMPDVKTLEELSALTNTGAQVILALNKIDVPSKAHLHEAIVKAYEAAFKPAITVRLSALKGEGVSALLDEVLKRLPESPPFYEKGQVSDRWERFFAAEIVREQVFRLFKQEIPHATAVVVEDFKEGKGGHPDEVHATLYVERDGQKGILLGPKGKVLRDLQARSETALADFIGRPVQLELWVKVRHNWRKDPRALKEFGYTG